MNPLHWTNVLARWRRLRLPWRRRRDPRSFPALRPRPRFFRRFAGPLFLLLATVALGAAPIRLLILHTNDIHDHVRRGESRVGGLPYVSGYIKQVRGERNDVLVLDAGDVTEKGDLVAFRSQGVMTFEALRRIGYDGVCIGNHDYDDVTLAHVRDYEKALGQGLLCLNIVGKDGAPIFTGSRIVEKAGLKIGLVGLIAPRPPGAGGLDLAASGRALAAEAKRLQPLTALIVAVCHQGPAQCAEWSRQAPEVQVFVSGHSHTVLDKPVVVPETGAVIVQAGSYARWVGRLELEIDPAAKKVLRHDGRLVAMAHDQIPVDTAMLAWVQERERALAPEADEFVCDNPAQLDHFAMARLGAEGLRRAAGADVAFCHTYQIIRDSLPAGRVDVNAVFKTGGMEGFSNVLIEMTGAQIVAYVNALVSVQREPPEWSGFRVTRPPAVGGDPWVADLAPERRYRVIMPRREWDTRLLRLREKLARTDPANPLVAGKLEPSPTDVHFTEATVAYIRKLLADGHTLQDGAARLASEREFKR